MRPIDLTMKSSNRTLSVNPELISSFYEKPEEGMTKVSMNNGESFAVLEPGSKIRSLLNDNLFSLKVSGVL